MDTMEWAGPRGRPGSVFPFYSSSVFRSPWTRLRAGWLGLGTVLVTNLMRAYLAFTRGTLRLTSSAWSRRMSGVSWAPGT